ncbi:MULTISPECIES: hypothetical protein [unclassified Streptomyces]|uniref:hypothetical protein n=1 Tax=unclassified Streptomyces TaxID=2593676 RepID=UPI00109E6C80|nr:hypothetical protein [Streptomyces sp. A1136]THA57991.1 hypothetical protein E6R62_05825 [Streptomyces sp. A1136]
MSSTGLPPVSALLACPVLVLLVTGGFRGIEGLFWVTVIVWVAAVLRISRVLGQGPRAIRFTDSAHVGENRA